MRSSGDGQASCSRHCDPATGQFLSRDPLVSRTRDAYGYARRSPFAFIDPSGLQVPPPAGPPSGEQYRSSMNGPVPPDADVIRQIASQAGLDLSEFNIYFSDDAPEGWYGSVNTNGAGNLVLDESGHYIVSLSQHALGCQEQLVRTLGHEMEHYREALADELDGLDAGLAHQLMNDAADDAGAETWAIFQASEDVSDAEGVLPFVEELGELGGGL